MLCGMAIKFMLVNASQGGTDNLFGYSYQESAVIAALWSMHGEEGVKIEFFARVAIMQSMYYL